jgi:hypothetical protein
VVPKKEPKWLNFFSIYLAAVEGSTYHYLPLPVQCSAWNFKPNKYATFLESTLLSAETSLTVRTVCTVWTVNDVLGWAIYTLL